MREYRISDDDIAAISTALYGRPAASHRDAMRAKLYAVRNTEPLSDLVHDNNNLIETLSEVSSARALAEQQRDFLMGQVSSLIERLGGAHVAAGLITMAAAQGFTQKEVLPINQVLAQIAGANAEQT